MENLARSAYQVALGDLQRTVDVWAPNVSGIGELSRGELAGERMTVAYEARSQEDEHSCFSDNTVKDIIGNARGIQMVWLGDYGDVRGLGLVDLVAAEDPLLSGLPNSDPDRRAVLATIEALEEQTDTIVSAGQAIGVTVSVS